MTSPKKIVYWFGYWIFFFALYVVAVVAFGALLFGLASPVIGFFFLPEYSLREVFLKSLELGARYGGVWAGGMSLVFCVIRAAKLRNANTVGNSNKLDTL